MQQSTDFTKGENGAYVSVGPTLPKAGPTVETALTLMPTASNIGTPSSMNRAEANTMKNR